MFPLVRRGLRGLSPSSLSYHRAIKDVNWQRLVIPGTHPSFISRMKELEAKFNEMRAELKGVPKSIDGIDWKHWRSQISDHQAVDALRAEFESFAVPPTKGLDLTEINATYDKKIKRAEENSTIAKELQEEAKQMREESGGERDTINDWTLWDYFDRYPGLQQQLIKEHEEGFQMPHETEFGVSEMDVNELRQKLKQTGEFPAPDMSATRLKQFGPIDFEALEKRYKQIERKMWGDSEIYQKQEAEEEAKRKEEEDKLQAAKKSHHH